MSISLGDGFSHVITEQGDIFGWGSNTVGQIGRQGPLVDIAQPVHVELRSFYHAVMPIATQSYYSGRRPIMMSAGFEQSLCLVEDGSVWTWGNNEYGQCGREDSDYGMAHLNIGEFGGIRVVQVACASRFSMVLTASGEVWNCGSGAFGQLGHGDSMDRDRMTRLNPDYFGGNTITFIAVGHEHSMALRGADSMLFTWGDDQFDSGCLGRVPRITRHESPLPVDADTFGSIGILSMSGGRYFSVVVTVDGAMWACGNNFNAQLGFPDMHDRPFFQRVAGSEVFGEGGVQITACQTRRLVVLANNGRVWIAGKLTYIEDHLGASGPHLLADDASFENHDVVDISCGHFHSALVKRDGQIYLWGNGEHGALGTGDDINITSPHRIPTALFGGARVGNNLTIDANRAIAFSLGNSPRTGAASSYVSLPPETITLMFNALRLSRPPSDAGPGLRVLIGFAPTAANAAVDEVDEESEDGDENEGSGDGNEGSGDGDEGSGDGDEGSEDENEGSEDEDEASEDENEGSADEDEGSGNGDKASGNEDDES